MTPRDAQPYDARPWMRPWPQEQLEDVSNCPACGSATRSVLYADLVDGTFRCAAGRWTMWRCAGCGGGYVSPRPTRESIHDAYRSYYTHLAAVPPVRDVAPSRLQRMRLALAHGYQRARYGLQRQPASALGVWVALLMPGRRRALDHICRHLPKPRPGAKLLDLGCGSGGFLLVARQCGWQVLGLEPDAKAAAQAAASGLEVLTGDVHALEGLAEAFDVITLSHVIEHVHEPVALLRACHRLLRPGGLLWLETPHIDSLGHRLFGPYWRGLEAPRHLVLFSRLGLRQALEQAGFGDVVPLRAPNPLDWMAQQSHAVRMELTPGASATLPWRLRWRLRASVCARLVGAGASDEEFLTWRARKPDS